MLTDDDLGPKTRQAKPRALDALSVPELRDYITQLNAEIARVEADIQKKEKHRAAMDSLFRTETK